MLVAENAAHRSIQACLECRRSKIKCDGLWHADSTCSRCKSRGQQCTWSVPVPPAITSQNEQRWQKLPNADVQQDRRRQHGRQQPTNSTSQSLLSPPLSGNSHQTPRSQSSEGTQRSRRSANSHRDLNTRTQSAGDDEQGRQKRHRLEHARRSQAPMPPFAQSIVSQTAPLANLRQVAMLSPCDEVASGKETADQRIGTSFQLDETITHNREDAESVLASDSESNEGESVDEQIRTLQVRMGWTQERLTVASIERRAFFKDSVGSEPETLAALDPVKSGLLLVSDVERLFAVYFEAINIQHCFLDQAQDTWTNVQAQSTALFVTICACAATMDHHHRSRDNLTRLMRNMEETTNVVLASSAKSVEVVKALLLAFLFTQKPHNASQDRCWTLVDSAARIANELGLGQRLRSAETGVECDDQSHRSAERAWAIAVLMQRSLGTFTGLWSVTKLDIQWEKLEEWSESELAIPGDVQHAAYLNLRRIEYFTRSQLQKMEQKRFLSLESIRVSFNALFEEWQRHWVEHPKLAGYYTCKSFLMIVGLHIQLLINFTALRLAQSARSGAHSTLHTVSPSLRAHCAQLATNFCHFFLDNFEKKANQLGRNFASMVTWSVMVLLQLKYRRGRLLATRVAVLLAGYADEEVYANTFPCFYGRWLLSLINDLAQTSSERKAAALLRHSHRNCPCDTKKINHGKKDCIQTSLQNRLEHQEKGHDNAASMRKSVGQSMHSEADQSSAFKQGAHTDAVSAEEVLSHMIGPLTADPFNEGWLNSFLDSLVPAPYSPEDIDLRSQANLANTVQSLA